MWVHRISGTIILLSTFILSVMAIVKSYWRLREGLHPIGGLAVLLLVFLLVIGGFLSRNLLNKVNWGTKKLLMIKQGHKWFGYLMIFVA